MFTSPAWNLNVHLLPLRPVQGTHRLQKHTGFRTQDFPDGFQEWHWMFALERAEVHHRNSQFLVQTHPTQIKCTEKSFDKERAAPEH